MRYKIGDRVRVRKDLKRNVNYSMEGNPFGIYASDKMVEKRNDVVTIKDIVPIGGKGTEVYTTKEDAYGWTDEMFSGFEDSCRIVITANGRTVTAQKRRGGKVLDEATAVCSPDDTFVFDKGAILAISRLTQLKAVEPFRGEMVCTCSTFPHFTKGRVYEVYNGKFRDDDGDIHPLDGGHIFSVKEANLLYRGDVAWMQIEEREYYD